MSEKEGESSRGSPQAGAVTVSDVQELIRRKEEIEAQIKANYGVLESVSVGAGLPGGVGAPRRLRPRPHPLDPGGWEALGAATAASVGGREAPNAENQVAWVS